jgi:hypothetical protein
MAGAWSAAVPDDIEPVPVQMASYPILVSSNILPSHF